MTYDYISGILVATMYIDSSTIKKNGKSYTRHLLRTSFREKGKVKHKTVANLSSCSVDEIEAIKLALKHKSDLSSIGSKKDIQAVLGKRFGAVWLISVLANRLGITKALGMNRNGKLALCQVIARIIDQGSRLSAVRFAQRHALCEVLDIDKLDEDDFYENLSWLSDQQEEIEKKLFNQRFLNTIPTLFLYDVTSSYLEGTCNELADWGYNRDKKRGKMQIVVGLLVGPDGLPVAVRVFEGNTNDTQTVSEQVRILADHFGVKQVTLVGDRGMLKGPQIDQLPDDFRYITAITKPQILSMLEANIIQYELFTDIICEVEDKGLRYVLRRNPMRAKQIAQSRQSKLEYIEKMVKSCNAYLSEHPRADVDTALEKVKAKITKLKIESWLNINIQQRVIGIEKDRYALEQEALLDGCYVIKSDVPVSAAPTQTLHDRYCDLENVERAFRTMKTAHLELRPIFVRKEKSTRGHVFVVMLALLLQRQLENDWSELDITVEEGIDELAAIHLEEVLVGSTRIELVPTPNELGRQLLEKAHITLPSVFPLKTVDVHTKKKLPSERIK